MDSRDTALSMAIVTPQIPEPSSTFIISEPAFATAQCNPTVSPSDPDWFLDPYLAQCNSSYLAPFIVADAVDSGPYHHEVNQMYGWALHKQDGCFTAPSSVAPSFPIYNPNYPSGSKQPADYENDPAHSTDGSTWQRMGRLEPPTAVEVPSPSLGCLQMDGGASEYKSMNGVTQAPAGSWHTNPHTAILYGANDYSETPHQTWSGNTTSAANVQLLHAGADPRQDAPFTAAEFVPTCQAEATDCVVGLVDRARSPVPPQRMPPAKGEKGMISCSICREQFHRPCSLRRHMYQHEGQHECMTCGKRFHEKYQLSNHAKSHAGPFACTQCPKTFEKRSSLRSHLPSHDGFRRLLDCPYTGCGSSSWGGLLLPALREIVPTVGSQRPHTKKNKKKASQNAASSTAVQTTALALALVQESGFQTTCTNTSPATILPSSSIPQAIYETETARILPSSMQGNLSRAVEDITRILPNGTILPQFLYGLGTLGVDSTQSHSHTTASTEMAMAMSESEHAAEEQIGTPFSTPYPYIYPYLGTQNITFQRR
ncbi:hypothetical protein LTR72_004595 [Exophiala xenobiotica]|nr:hypothetical protein LTR72_004595 [Exophiala xenobiotica]KAK5293896.1 hypothetical protein LTR14_004787 [Exophiala xenobiotica]KAK5496949.1 hypothetical protein LTR55_001439 [Exophiala xenobiotica]